MEEQTIRQCHDLFIKLTKGYLTGEFRVTDDFKDADWGKLREIAYRTGMTPFLCEVIQRVYEKYPFEKQLYDRFVNGTIMMGLKEERKIDRIKKILEKAQENGITLLVFKGPILADVYTDYRLRVSSDTDIYVDEENKAAMMEILISMGYVWLKEKSKEHVQNFEIPEVHYLELHTALWEDFRGSRIEILKSFELTAKKNRIKDTFCGVSMETIRYEEQLIYFVYHFAKHMVLETVTIRNVIDILLFYKKHVEKINTETFRQRLKELGYWNCFEILCQLGVEQLGFQKSLFPEYEEADSETIDQLMAVLLSEQVTRDDDVYRWQMVYNMTPYLTGDYDPNMSGFKRKLTYLFPTRRNMPEKYSYAKKCVLLVPIAWIHRIGDYIVARFIKRSYRMPGSKRMNRMDAKLKILEKMKLI